MTDYKNIFGKPVKFLATDPDNAEAEGQIWYNSTSDAFKSIISNEAWSSSANTNITRGSGYGFGTLTAGVTGTGEQGPPGFAPAVTEEYNGSGWATGNSYPTQVFLIKGTGTQTAGIAAGGRTPSLIANANVYNGTSWTAAGGNLSVAKTDGGMFGIQTAAIYCGGATPTPGLTNDTELYDGSTWSELNNMPVNKQVFATAGTSTAAIASGGRLAPGPSTNSTDEWDGTNWTAGPSLNTARRYLQGWGSQTSALVCGGSPDGAAASALTEIYDGTSWSETADLASARHFLGTSQNQGSNTSGWAANGNAGATYFTATEEYNKSINVITAAAWSAGGNLNTGGQNGGGAGTQTAALAYGGDTGRQAPGTTESYDGSTWTNTPATLNTKRYNGHGFGSQSGAVALGGISYPPLGVHNVTEEYDGSTWTNATAQPAFSYQNGTAGSLIAGIVFGGNGTAPGESVISTTNEYDGTNWTSGGALNNARSSTTQGGAGTQTACLCAGTRAGSPINPSALVEEYNGTSWTSGGALNAAKTMGGMAGVQTNALLYGGGPTTALSLSSENYDGTSWVTSVNMASPRSSCMPATQATADTSLAVGSVVAPTYAQTEEFNAETTALNLKTLTTS